jgi:hypothetical protein
MDYDNQKCAHQESPTAGYAAPGGHPAYTKPYRATAQDAIQNRVNEYRHAINQLEALSRSLPNELPLLADEILRELVLGY